MSPVRAAVRRATDRLTAAGVESPEHDARALAVHALGLSRPSDLLLIDRLDEDAEGAYDELVSRRAARVPLQHLVGSTGFRYLELDVGPGVFVPRPETEAVVQWAVDALRERGTAQPLCVDLCTGSGAIALSLAHEVSGARVHAVERDETALAWTKRNARRRIEAGDPEIRLHLGSAEHALPELDGTVDLVISNPPYVATDETHVPEPEVLDHDPGLALWGGRDGLEVARLVARAAHRLLVPGGLLAMEHSDRQGETAPAMLCELGGWESVCDHRDAAGRDRFVTAVRAGEPRPPA